MDFCLCLDDYNIGGNIFHKNSKYEYELYVISTKETVNMVYIPNNTGYGNLISTGLPIKDHIFKKYFIDIQDHREEQLNKLIYNFTYGFTTLFTFITSI